MSPARPKQRPLTRLLQHFLLLGLILRVAVPAGYMPTDLDDGWFLQLCPDGMPAHVMVAWLGEGHRHHESTLRPQQSNNHHQGHHNQHNIEAEATPAPSSTAQAYVQCDLGGTLGADAVAGSASALSTTQSTTAALTLLPIQPALPQQFATFRPRAPPGLSFT